MLPWKRISTGCAVIDEIIRGGVPINGITEIVGASGVGKTQLCLQLSLMTQFPVEYGGINKGRYDKEYYVHKSLQKVILGTLYICTEDAFPSKRLSEISEKLPLHCKLNRINFKDNVFVEHLDDFVS